MLYLLNTLKYRVLKVRKNWQFAWELLRIWLTGFFCGQIRRQTKFKANQHNLSWQPTFKKVLQTFLPWLFDVRSFFFSCFLFSRSFFSLVHPIKWLFSFRRCKGGIGGEEIRIFAVSLFFVKTKTFCFV